MWKTVMRLAAALRSHQSFQVHHQSPGHTVKTKQRVVATTPVSFKLDHFQKLKSRKIETLALVPSDLRVALFSKRRIAAAALPADNLADEAEDHDTSQDLAETLYTATNRIQDIIEPHLKSQMNLNLGYVCDNLTLRASHRIFTNRSCIKRTYDERGLEHVGTLALQNCCDLARIIQWNYDNGIYLFRVSSQLFPWSGQYKLEDLPNYTAIAEALSHAGALARACGQRLTSHPPHFIKLASTDESLRQRSIADLEIQGQIFDLMGFAPSHFNKMNIHIGGTYGNKTRTLERFARTFESLTDSVRLRLTVENDDRPNSYSIADLLPLHSMTGIPLTFDFHHHQFCPGNQTQQEAFEAAISTWPAGVRPVVHWSETPECPERQRTHPHAHSAFVYGPIHLYGKESEVDVMIESKAKEVALLMYRDEIAPRLEGKNGLTAITTAAITTTGDTAALVV